MQEMLLFRQINKPDMRRNTGTASFRGLFQRVGFVKSEFVDPEMKETLGFPFQKVAGRF